METNEEMIEKRFGLLPEEIKYATTKEISISKILEMLNEARDKGYKEGQKDIANQIFSELECHIYISKETKNGDRTKDIRKGNVALDLTKAEFEDFKKQFEVD